MFYFSIAQYIYVLFIFLIPIFSGVTSFERSLSVVKLKCDNATHTHCDKLAIVQAQSTEDTLYYLWDFGSKPTFLIVHVPVGTNITVDWDRFAEYQFGSVRFTSKPSLVFGTVVNKLYEFDVQSNTTIAYNTEDFYWNVTELVDAVTRDRAVFSTGGRLRNAVDSGFFNISMCAYGLDGTAVHTPHLVHSANSSQIDVVLDNFRTSFSFSRFAIEMIVFSSVSKPRDEFVAQRTLDDENTPGVFILDTFSVTEEKNRSTNPKNAYLQWRPIVYTTNEMVVTSSVKAKQNIDIVHNDTILNATLVNAVYGQRISNFFVKALNVSFGTEADKFYAGTHYSSWSFILGVGDEPKLPYSLGVILIIIFTAGLPILIAVSSIAFFIYKQVKRSEPV